MARGLSPDHQLRLSYRLELLLESPVDVCKAGICRRPGDAVSPRTSGVACPERGFVKPNRGCTRLAPDTVLDRDHGAHHHFALRMSEALGVLAGPEADRGSALRHVLVLVLAVAVGLSFGLVYGQGTHNTYLLHGLRQLDPEFLQYDWLAAHTTHYHHNFALVLRLLAALGPLPWAVAIANVVLVASVLLALYAFLLRYFRADAFNAMLLLMFLVILDRTNSVGNSHILTFTFEPSSLAGSLVLIALLLLIAGRYVLSGILMAIGGYFHTNFLLLDFVFFGLAHILLGPRDLMKRLLVQFTPALLILAYQAPVIQAMATDPQGAEARHMFLFVRSPHHYVPMSYLPEFIPFLGWHLLALGLAGQQPAEPAVLPKLLRIYGMFLGIVVAATVLTTVVFVPLVSQLYFWRMAPFSVLLAQLIITTAVSHSLRTGAWWGRGARARWRWTFAGAGGILLLVQYLWRHPPASSSYQMIMVALAILGASIAGTACARRTEWGCRSRFKIPSFAAPLAILAVALFLVAPDAHRVSNVLHGFSATKEALFKWARTTDRASQFLIPPSLQCFRLHAGRAVVVDWKSPPILPSEFLEWYRRMGRVSGNPAVWSEAEAERGYARIDQARIDALEQEFGIRYAIFKKPFDTGRIAGRIVFVNDDYVVFDLG